MAQALKDYIAGEKSPLVVGQSNVPRVGAFVAEPAVHPSKICLFGLRPDNNGKLVGTIPVSSGGAGLFSAVRWLSNDGFPPKSDRLDNYISLT